MAILGSRVIFFQASEFTLEGRNRIAEKLEANGFLFTLQPFKAKTF